MSRTILHCDMNNFYASVECMLDMSLKDKPIAVGGDVENRHGIILAKNYHAKKYGIQTGEALWQAKQKCKDLIIVPPHYDEYIKYSNLAREIYSQYTDLIEPYGMDECWLDVSGCTSLYGSGEEIANKLRMQMKFELGLTISVGVSFNKIFAKLGSDMKKPDATTVIPEETFREKIWGLPASDLLGVGRATEKVLNSYCIKTIGDLAQTPPQLLKNRLGKCGEMIVLYANGLDYSPVASMDFEPPIKSIGHGITTREDLINSAEVWNVMLSLVQDIGHKLRKYGKKAGGVAIYVRNNKLETKQWQCQLPVKTCSSAVIAEAAYELFVKSYVWNNDIRSVTVRAINLISQSEPEQLSLFSDAKKVMKKEQLEYTLEVIKERFGKDAIVPATLCKTFKMPTDRDIELQMPTGMVM